MINLFISIRFLDILDILLVALLLYHIYKLIRGTSAFTIFLGIFLIYLFWLFVKALNMEMLSSILGQLFGVGVLALLIVFQQEIRRFFLLVGSQYNFKNQFNIEKAFKFSPHILKDENLKKIVDACQELSETKTGALIVVSEDLELREYVNTGESIDAKITKDLIKAIFFKNNPLHDGAVIIVGNKIKAARCILPVTSSLKINPRLGLRHRAAIGMSEAANCPVIIVSEETGKLSVAYLGQLTHGITHEELFLFLRRAAEEEEEKTTIGEEGEQNVHMPPVDEKQ